MENEQYIGYTTQENTGRTASYMDSDSYQIAIDICCSYSIAKSRKYSQDHWCHAIQGLAWGCTVNWKGTWKFDLEDDKGIKPTIKIQNTIYCKELAFCLILTKHWSHQSENPSGKYSKLGHQFMELIYSIPAVTVELSGVPQDIANLDGNVRNHR